jgi:hypothetical protein
MQGKLDDVEGMSLVQLIRRATLVGQSMDVSLSCIVVLRWVKKETSTGLADG